MFSFMCRTSFVSAGPQDLTAEVPSTEVSAAQPRPPIVGETSTLKGAVSQGDVPVKTSMGPPKSRPAKVSVLCLVQCAVLLVRFFKPGNVYDASM